MRKIISILLALGVILALTMMAAPVSAVVTGPGSYSNPTVSLSNYCACEEAAYNITFKISAGLAKGVHQICIKFPAGTTVPATGLEWEDGDIIVHSTWWGAQPVFGDDVEVSGTEVCFVLDRGVDPTFNNPLTVEFTEDAEIANPCDPDNYRLEVKTTRAPDNVYVKSMLPGYEIIPCFSSYGFYWDASPTYPGIGYGFVPPFKACGQNVTYEGYDNWESASNSSREFSGGFQNRFYIEFCADPAGCLAPCDEVDVYMQLTKAPQTPEGFPLAKVTLNLTESEWAATPWNPIWNGVLSYDATKPGNVEPNLKVKILDDFDIDEETDVAWYGWIHFDTVGEYALHVWAECPSALCMPDVPDPLAEETFEFTVHQQKDAAKIELDEKWNLISLPLVPFDTDLESMLASLYTWDTNIYKEKGLWVDNLLSIWNYDAATGDWLVYGNGQDSLTTIEDGTSYWFRLRYPLEADAYWYTSPPENCGNYTWWVFGTQLPEPPAGPKVYPVVEGWNMVGFTSMKDALATVYLENWDENGEYPEPVIYGWDQGCFAKQGWSFVNFQAGDLASGQGYWMAFPSAGSVFQIVP